MQCSDSSTIVPPAAGIAEVVYPGVAAASNIDEQAADLAGPDVAKAAATSRRLRMLPMEGHRGEWLLSPVAGSDENKQNGEKPEEEGNIEEIEDWLITHADADADADDYSSDYYANDARVHDGKSTVDAREHHGQQATEEEEIDWSTDDVGVTRQAHPNRVTAFSSSAEPGGSHPTLGQLDKRDGLWAEGTGVAKFDHDGGTHSEQGILPTNLYSESKLPRKEFSPPGEAEVLLSRRRYRRPDESQAEGSEASSVASWQSEDNENAPGTWDTDDDFLIHVTHYSRVAKGNQHRAPAAAEPVRRRRQWQQDLERYWDTDDDVLYEEPNHHQPGTASSDGANDPAAAQLRNKALTWESWVTDDDDFSLYDVSTGVSSTPKEEGQKQIDLPEVAHDEQFLERQFDGGFAYYYYDYRASVSSGDGDGEQGAKITDDWDLGGGTYYFEDQILTATKEGHKGHKKIAEEEEVVEDGPAFGSMASYFERLASNRDETPGAAAELQLDVGEKKEDGEGKASIEPYGEYDSYLVEMKQLRPDKFFGRFFTGVQLQQQHQPPARHGAKTAATSVVDAEQRTRPLEKQSKEWGRLGPFMKPLLETRSLGENRGPLGFLESLLPSSIPDGRDEASSSEEHNGKTFRT